MKLLDTTIFIEMLKEKRYEPAAISIITLIEVLRGLEDRKRGSVKQLIEESFEVKGLETKPSKPTAPYTRSSERRARHYLTLIYS